MEFLKRDKYLLILKVSGLALLEDIQDQRYANDKELDQFEDYLDISQEYENFKPVAEFHDYYEEFPTVYGDEEAKRPEEEERKDRKDSGQEAQTASANSLRALTTVSSTSASGSRGHGPVVFETTALPGRIIHQCFSYSYRLNEYKTNKTNKTNINE